LTKTIASPHYLVQVRLKEKWIQFQFLILYIFTFLPFYLYKRLLRSISLK
jgi:hypothetical protein